MTTIDFLANKRVSGQGQPFTHTTIVPYRAKFYLEEDDESEFWQRMGRDLVNGVEYGILEKPSKYGPARFDFDFKMSLDEGLQRKYTLDDIQEIVNVVQNTITQIVDPSEFNKRLTYCILLEKPSPRTDSGYIKDGFHLHFPFFVCDAYTMDCYIRGKLIQKMTNDPVFKNFRENVVKKIVDTKSDKLTFEQQIQKLIDMTATKTWMTYGSIKEKGANEWKVTACFDDVLNRCTIGKIFKQELAVLKNDRKKSINYYVPRLLSIQGRDKPTLLVDLVKKSADQYYQQKTQRKKSAVKCVRPMEKSLEDLKTIEEGKLMDMIADWRADDHDQWRHIGRIIFDIGQGCDKALDMWIEFSKRSEKFDKPNARGLTGQAMCEYEWDHITLGGLTLGSLYMIIKNDSPDKYKLWRCDQIDFLLYDAVKWPKPRHSDVAMVMHKMYNDRYVCASSKHDLWYEFYNHRWHEVDNGASLILMMMTEVQTKFLDFVNRLTEKAQDPQAFEKEKNEKRRDRAYKIMAELGQAGFCGNVLKMCKVLFLDANFLKKMNENRDLLSFENGVYDLKQGLFRDGSPDDYITFSTGRNYHNFDWQDQEIIDCEEYLSKVFVNPVLRDYFQYFLCSCFQGGNRSKIFAVFTGPTDAGKSLIMQLIEIIFGEYAVNFPRETFVVGSGKSAGGARPDLARVRGKRIAFVKEIAKNETLHIGVLKELTGNDSFFARTLFEKGSDIRPMFTLILMCNEPPKIPANDDAMWNRVKCLPFESIFPKPDDRKRPIPEDEAEQRRKKVFPRDPHLEERIHEYAAALTWMLLQKFKVYYKEGYNEPDEVKMSTGRYQTDNDIYMQFVENKLVKIDDKTQVVKLRETYSMFNRWYRINYPAYLKQKPGQMDFEKEMTKRLGERNKKTKAWEGYAFIDDEDEPQTTTFQPAKTRNALKMEMDNGQAFDLDQQ